MVNIRPQGTVYLLQHIPLRPDLNVTIYPWKDKQAQFDWFYKHKLLTIDNVSRVRGNSIIVEAPEDSINYANYMIYKNTGFSNKWFYAFVTSFEPINNTTTRIYYQLDLFQSWCFDWQIQPCFVDREHVNDDTIGANTVPENLEHGDYIVGTSAGSGCFSSYNIGVLYAPYQSEGTLFPPIVGDLWGKVYNGLQYKSGDVNTIGGFISKFIQDGNGSNIACVFMIPSVFDSTSITSKTFSVDRPSYGFTPKNNKLFTHDYMYCLASNLEGQQSSFAFEMFDNAAKPSFTVSGCRSASFTAFMIPNGYKNGIDKNSALSLGNFPLCAYYTSSYQTYLARTQSINALQKTYLERTSERNTEANAVQSSINGLQSAQLNAQYADAASGLLSTFSAFADNVMTGGVSTWTNYASGIVGAVGAAHSIENQRSQMADRWKLQGLNYAGAQSAIQQQIAMINATVNSHAVGGASMAGNLSGHTAVNGNMKDFYVYGMRIKDEFARIIDDYFSMYGYAIHRIKYPNFTGRQNWNYVKTVGVVFKGYDIPLDMQMNLAKSLDNGMTFWHDPESVGDYTRPNGIVTE